MFSLRHSALLLATAIIAPASLHADEVKPVVSVDREGAIYSQGEEVTFVIETQGKPPTRYGRLEWKTTLNGKAAAQTGGERLKEGTRNVTFAPEAPGFVRLEASVNPDSRLSRPKLTTAAAALAVSPDQITAGAPAPEDFGDYWTAQKEALAAIPATAEMKPVSSDNPKLVVFDVKVESLGKPVSGYLARPEGAAEKSLPAIIRLHGAGVSSSSKKAAMEWAARNMLALDINVHGIPNGESKEYYEELRKGELNGYATSGADSRDSFYFNGVYLRLIRAIDFLTSQPEWDGRTIIAYGSSQGGAQAIVAAGLDSRVTFYAAGVPALCDLSADLAGRPPGWPRGLVSGAGAEIIRSAVSYYDVVNFAARLKVPGIISVGFLDATCPPSSVYAAINAIPADTPKTVVNNPESAHSVPAETVKAFQDAITEHLNR